MANYPTSLDNFSDKTALVDSPMAAHINNIQDVVQVLEAKVGIDSSAVATSLDYKVNNFFVENTRMMWFYENTAPTGWTVATDLSASDAVVAVKGGSQDYNVNGGNVAGSWLQPSHSLTATEIPAHTHTYYRTVGRRVYDDTANIYSVRIGSNTTTTGSIGGGGSHSHGNTYRPYSAIGILAQYTGA